MAKSRRDQKYPFDDLANQQDIFSIPADPFEDRFDSKSVQSELDLNSFNTSRTSNKRIHSPQQKISRGYTLTRRRRQNNLIMVWAFITMVLAMIAILLGVLASNAGKVRETSSSANAATNSVPQEVLDGMQMQQSQIVGVEQMPNNEGNFNSGNSSQPEDLGTDAPSGTGAKTLADLPPSAENPVIALTFDDGPSEEFTPELLNMLKEQEVKATFFLLGSRVDSVDNRIVQRMVADGHEIANHSYSHAVLIHITEEEVRQEIQKTNEAIFNAANVYPTLLRPPQGDFNNSVLSIAGSFQLPVVHWSSPSCPQDWKVEYQNADYIANFVVNNAANGHIVLLHDIHKTTVDAIPAMIEGLKEKGYRFATVSELMAYNVDGFEAGTIHYQCDVS